MLVFLCSVYKGGRGQTAPYKGVLKGSHTYELQYTGGAPPPPPPPPPGQSPDTPLMFPLGWFLSFNYKDSTKVESDGSGNCSSWETSRRSSTLGGLAYTLTFQGQTPSPVDKLMAERMDTIKVKIEMR